MKVTYLKFDDSEESEDKVETLGVETYENIGELLLPDATKTNITITRYFNGYSQHRWLVKSIELNDSNITMRLEPRSVEGEVFLQQTMNRIKRSAGELLRFGTIVEVDFGFKPKIYRGSDTQTSAKRYPDTVQHHELYKRRPAIVLKATRRGVQVVPLTSQEPEDYKTNSSVFKVSANSLKDCIKLKQKDSYVLSHLIQTISFTRILPPLSVNKSRESQRLDTYRIRLDSRDQKALSTALANNVGLNDYYDMKAELREVKPQIADLEGCLEVMTESNTELDVANKQLECSLSDLQNRYDTLRVLLRDQYVRSETFTRDNVEDEIDKELIIFEEVLTG